jgi:hypothetical protein
MTVRPMSLARSTRPASLGLPYDVWFPLLVFTVTRAVDAAMVEVASRHQVALIGADPSYHLNYSSPADPGYALIAANWDGQWYRLIADAGYPLHLPVGPTGHVAMSTWAFYPLYPLSAALLSRMTGLPFTTVGPVLNLALGAAAVLLMYRLLRRTTSAFVASATTLLTCTFMAAPALQLDYTESLALLLVCLALTLLQDRRYAGFALSALALALTRPIALALVPVVAAHWWVRDRGADRGRFPTKERWRVGLLVPWCVAVTGIWPLVAAVVTRDTHAYLETMSAWKAYQHNTPIISWLGYVWRGNGVAGLVVCAVATALLVLAVRRPAARAWGVEVRTWAWAYPAYLVIAAAPGPSVIRYLLLAFPLLWPWPEVESYDTATRLQRGAVVVLASAGLVLQWIWISVFVVITHTPHHGPFP